jgi:hypothetical protein
MSDHCTAEKISGTNTDWLGLRVASVLLNPFMKSFRCGGETDTAATAEKYGIGVIRRMRAMTTTEAALDG